MEWFKSWFDTEFYHILYRDRNYQEAEFFLENLMQKLQFKSGDKVLDLACGKGRHSLFLNSKGFDVTGIDLSKQSVECANHFANQSLRFEVHDMRNELREQYDVILNLFTSFGYFQSREDDLKVLRNIKKSLRNSNSVAVIDFLNVNFAEKKLKKRELISKGGIEFDISKSSDDLYIKKEIKFKSDNSDYCFTERVKKIYLSDFIELFNECDLNLIATFGSYSLEEFDQENSERLILIFKK